MIHEEKTGDVNIRKVDRNDVAALCKICELHAAFEQTDFERAGLDIKLTHALFDLPTKLTVYVAKRHATCVGYISLTRDFSTWAGRDFLHMDCLFVVEAVRGLGIGRKLFDAAVNECEVQGVNELQWQTPTWNAKAIAFYDALGAQRKSKFRYAIQI
jgi:GNAT superfamily N-acetyltransferase